jgi:glycosyltransferase involved in cell wall biosynthesis
MRCFVMKNKIPTIAAYQARPPNPQRVSGGLARPHNPGPLVSIVTIVRNGEHVIEKTFKSVFEQDYPNVEYVVVDGASQDKTVDIIRKYESRISSWISEPDAGIYDAMNKGVALCSGEIIGLLNADDRYEPDVVKTVVESLDVEHAELAYGVTRIVDSTGRVVGRSGRRFDVRKLFGSVGFMHPSVFVTRKAYEKVGLFDLRFRCGADSDWILRAHNENVKFVQSRHTCYMSDNGVSNKSLKFIGYGEYLQSLSNNGFPIRIVYQSMAWIGLRSLLNLALGRRGL